MQPDRMSADEVRAGASLAGVFGLRVQRRIRMDLQQRIAQDVAIFTLGFIGGDI